MMCPLELTLFDADLLASVAPYLDAKDLTNLASTCRCFGAAGRAGHGDDVHLPLIQEAARRAILNEQTKTERAALVRYPGESWIDVYQQLLMLREPLNFDVLVGNKHLEYVDGDKSRVFACRSDSLHAYSAISNHIMRGGKHYAEFAEVSGRYAWAGLMRPISSGCWGELGKLERFHPEYLTNEVRLKILQGRSERWGTSNIDSCMYSFNTGRCLCRNWEDNQANPCDLEGWERFECLGSRRDGYSYVGVLGLLLDLDAGTLMAYKNGRRLGVMCDGLAGEYCWVASILGKGKGGISMKRGAILPVDA